MESEVEVVTSEAEAKVTKPETRALHLLVIDDEPMVADVTQRMLEMCGHVVRVASQPEDAFGIWAQYGPTIDLVICDVAMAHMRGPELIARLSAGGVVPRVLFITGYSEEALHAELRHPVLTKPFTATALWRAVGDAVG